MKTTNLMEIFSMLFFKGITTAGTTASTFLLATYINNDMNLYTYYILFGTALGLIISFYVYPNLSKTSDTTGLIVTIFMVSLISYLPSSAVIYNWVSEKAIQNIDIQKPNMSEYKKLKKEYFALKLQRTNYINQPIVEKEIAKSGKIQHESYLVDLNEYNLRKLESEQKCNTRWPMPSYRTKNKECRKDFTWIEPVEQTHLDYDLSSYDREYEAREKGTYLVESISLVKEKMEASSPNLYNNALKKAKAKVPSFYVIAFLTFVIGLIFESLGELKYFFRLRANAIAPVKKTDEPKEQENVLCLPMPINTTSKVSIEKELTLETLLEERYKGVKVGQNLNSSSKLPFKKGRPLDTTMSKLNKLLKEGGFIKGRTHHEVLKGLSDAKLYIHKIAA